MVKLGRGGEREERKGVSELEEPKGCARGERGGPEVVVAVRGRKTSRVASALPASRRERAHGPRPSTRTPVLPGDDDHSGTHRDAHLQI